MIPRRQIRNVLIGTITLLGVLAPPFAGAAAADRADSAPRWRLVDYRQSKCFSSHVTVGYYGIWIEGRWKHAIDVGAEDLPASGSYTTSYAPIPPGSSTGEYSLAYVHVTLPSDEPVGTYTAKLWASDSRTRDTVPIRLVVRSSCGY
jgi:hypothetical protein